MKLIRSAKKTVVDRAKRDPEFRQAIVDEAKTLLSAGEAAVAKAVLRELVEPMNRDGTRPKTKLSDK